MAIDIREILTTHQLAKINVCEIQFFFVSRKLTTLRWMLNITCIVKNSFGPFFWNSSSRKVKHETLCNDYNSGGLKNGDISNKIIALQ